MKSTKTRVNIRARAFPSGDDNVITNAANARAFPRSDAKVVAAHHPNQKLRIANWNVGSMTGRSSELSEVLLRRRVNICCIQETKWKGSKSRDIGDGFKLLYNGANTNQNGVGIVIDQDLQERVVEVNRVSDRLMAIKFALDNQPCMNVVSAYAPQSGCSTSEKEIFWNDLDDLMQSIPTTETKYILGDFNGHIGQKSPVNARVHGGYGYGTTNPQGKDILQFAATYDLAIINSFFSKPHEHLITYKSGGKSTQIDYIMADRPLLKTFRDCKVIPGEPLTSQHRLLVADYIMPRPIKVRKDKRAPKINWHKLAREEGQKLCSDLVAHLEENQPQGTADTIWTRFRTNCIQLASKHLGVSKGAVCGNKNTNWWTDDVKQKLELKKTLFKTWQNSKEDADREAYRSAKNEAKRAVAQAKAISAEDFYARLHNTKDGRELFKIAKQRHNNTRDTKTVKYIKNEQGVLLTSNADICKRWEEYYSHLLNEAYPSEELIKTPPTEGPIFAVTPDEVRASIKAMANNKATGPDDIPTELWKKLGTH